MILLINMFFKSLICKIENKEKGFTFLELIITIFIFVVGILGAYSVSVMSVSDARVANERVTAIYLAQEGIELVKNFRDQNLVLGTNTIPAPLWSDGLDGSGGGKDYQFGYRHGFTATSLTPLACSNIPCSYNDLALIDFDSVNGYNYGVGPDTIFKRKIRIEDGTDSIPTLGYPNKKITVTVYWKDKREYSISVSDNINGYWQP